ncbi:MAG: hypothetical protein ACLQFR_17240 [Streptosporangiaceae bacterium]
MRTRVRNRPGVARGPLRMMRRPKTSPADVEVVPDELLEEDPPADRLVQYLGEGELGLQHRDLIPVPAAGWPDGQRISAVVHPAP